MNLKTRTIQLISQRKFAELVDLVDQDKRAVKYLYSLLYDPESTDKWNAVDALGYLARKLADKDKEFFRNIIRRFLWMMNEEGGNSSWSAPEAIGEIIYNQPELFGDLAPMMITAALDEAIFQKGMLWAVGRFGEKIPDEVQKFEEEIMEFLYSEDLEIMGLAIRAVGNSGFKKAIPILQTMSKKNDKLIQIYTNGTKHKVTIETLVREALSKLEAK